ncbi:hypothetical protein B0H14DRAFT_3498236 [Mycena olivaceomarginata]|nr:hypothetical protein B0H14DRAFT_3498236 [Mycena olivaceomarginata]
MQTLQPSSSTWPWILVLCTRPETSYFSSKKAFIKVRGAPLPPTAQVLLRRRLLRPEPQVPRCWVPSSYLLRDARSQRDRLKSLHPRLCHIARRQRLSSALLAGPGFPPRSLAGYGVTGFARLQRPHPWTLCTRSTALDNTRPVVSSMHASPALSHTTTPSSSASLAQTMHSALFPSQPPLLSVHSTLRLRGRCLARLRYGETVHFLYD